MKSNEIEIELKHDSNIDKSNLSMLHNDKTQSPGKQI